MRIGVFVIAVAVLMMADMSLAQPKEPIGRLVADLRAASVGLPAVEGWTPIVPSTTEVPARSLGLEVGAHLYVARLRGVTFGIGATFLTGRGTTSAPEAGSGQSLPGPNPDVTTRLRSVVPQVSLNFGHSLGWSYISAGLGRTRVESEATPRGMVTFAPRDSDWTKTLNYGGGARWFITDHLGVSFDLRWHKLSLVPASGTRPGAPRASLLTAGAGLTFK